MKGRRRGGGRKRKRQEKRDKKVSWGGRKGKRKKKDVVDVKRNTEDQKFRWSGRCFFLVKTSKRCFVDLKNRAMDQNDMVNAHKFW